MIRHLFCVACATLLTLSGKCQVQPVHPDLVIEQPAGPKPWTNLNFNDKPGQFQFVVVTDRTGGHRPGIFEKGVDKVNLLQPEFVISVGDLIEGYTTDTIEINRQWDEFNGFVNKLEMPFFYVPGNHDLTNPVMEQIWKKRIGPTHYYFIYKDVLFMALNSEDQTRGSGKGSISPPQLEWIKKTLEANQNVKWTFLFMHQPLWIQDTHPVNWFDVEKLLAPRKHTVFVGHRHHYERFERNNTQYYMLATTGGASLLRGARLGEFDHFAWVTMTDRGPIIANLELDGVFDHNVFNQELSAFTEKLWDTEVVRMEQPLYINGTSFTQDSVRFRITNNFDVPVKVKLDHGFSWDFKTDLGQPEITVQPNSVEFFSLELTARKNKMIEPMRPVKMKAEVAVQQPGKSDFYVPFEFNVAPLRKYELKKTNDPIKADGSLNDWSSLPHTLATTEPGSKFGIAYDAKNVYLGIQVNDSELVNAASGTTFNQDFAGFVLDAQPMAKSVSEKGADWFKNSLYFIASPEDESGKSSVWDLGENEKQLTWKCVKNKSGYAFEIAIPLEYVKNLQGDQWQNVRVNVVVQDKDAKSSERVMWQPNWRERDNIPGSGMFFRDAKAKM